MKNYKKIELDKEVIVRLTDKGINTLCNFYCENNIKSLKKHLKKNLNLKTKELKVSLADLITIFGERPFIKGSEPFENCCIYIAEENIE